MNDKTLFLFLMVQQVCLQARWGQAFYTCISAGAIYHVIKKQELVKTLSGSCLCAQVYSNGRQRLEDLCALPYHTYKDIGVNMSDRCDVLRTANRSRHKPATSLTISMHVGADAFVCNFLKPNPVPWMRLYRMKGAVEERDLQGVHDLRVSACAQKEGTKSETPLNTISKSYLHFCRHAVIWYCTILAVPHVQLCNGHGNMELRKVDVAGTHVTGRNLLSQKIQTKAETLPHSVSSWQRWIECSC
jgi:hypothetical protein